LLALQLASSARLRRPYAPSVEDIAAAKPIQMWDQIAVVVIIALGAAAVLSALY
jgi:hypothetical protein